MLDLTGVTHTYRFRLSNVAPVKGARGMRATVTADSATVKVNDRGQAFSVVVAGRCVLTHLSGNAIFYRQDLTDDHPTALSLAIAAEREFAHLLPGARSVAAPREQEPPAPI